MESEYPNEAPLMRAIRLEDALIHTAASIVGPERAEEQAQRWLVSAEAYERRTAKILDEMFRAQAESMCAAQLRKLAIAHS